MVFDEVDSGIGGAIAEIVGKELRALGARGQVLCVTHLPQVASQGHHHLRVAKLTDGRTTRTTLTDLSTGDRVEEIARMLGGVEVTAKAREHAKEMLKVASDTATGETQSSRSRRWRNGGRAQCAGPHAPGCGIGRGPLRASVGRPQPGVPNRAPLSGPP